MKLLYGRDLMCPSQRIINRANERAAFRTTLVIDPDMTDDLFWEANYDGPTEDDIIEWREVNAYMDD